MGDTSVSDYFIKRSRAHGHPKTTDQTGKGGIYKHVDIRILFPLLYLVLTAYLRPSTPYADMSMSLPVKVLKVICSSTETRVSLHSSTSNPWPFPDLVQSKYWERPKGYFKGWAPGEKSILAKVYQDRVPTWLPRTPPVGFHKWVTSNDFNTDDTLAVNDTEHEHIGNKAERNGMFYNPVGDPLRITNQDEEVLEILGQAFKAGTVRIKHVALIMLESTREELFPLQQGSDIHRHILRSHKGQKDEDDVNTILSQLTPVAERITGKHAYWRKSNGSQLPEVPIPEWNDTTQDGFGGINVVGGFTTSSLSFKSLAATYCGVWPLPIDNFEESELQCYQPCITQILHLFNQMKESKTTPNDFLDQEWLTAFFQSITEKYDRQDLFNRKMGIEKIVAKDFLERNATTRSELEKINYFGYPETTLTTHVRELIEKVQRENKRMFFSHFTSTMHHPWGLPDDFKKVEYINTQGKMAWHKDFNNYLNTVRFTDSWLGELLNLFDQAGITNETLVVVVGDHGQAFREDISTRTGTYKNSHVSNFRVPITFRHPHIPRVQYEANATSISVLPTILDLLINTGSLNRRDTAVASDLMHDYEGQSLIRPYKPAQNGRRAWNFGVINSGASMLSVTSADTPWRLVIPLDHESQWRFTDLTSDRLELQPLERWSVEQLTKYVRTIHGEEAELWVTEADAVAKWWASERKGLWGYKGKR